MNIFYATCSIFLALASCTLLVQADEEVSFNQHIRPIFISKCTKCHGGAKTKGDLSLIYRSEVLGKGKSGKTIIVPGKPENSELYRRIITDDIDDKMPLQTGDHADEPLNDEEVTLIRKWIQQGAHWQEHWAYIKPKKHALPTINNTSWPITQMDNYVLARLEANNLTPAAPAERAQWLRRASLDIIGLPPSIEELNAFISNKSADAFEKEISRLLASPHFGERWAAVWMDLARYSDTMGYEKDPHRDIWPYRDYLIQSFNNDKPYDQFIREQLAGDLFKNPTSEQLTATAFHRNTQTNTEGGTDDEEYRISAIIDRVNTTWTATQGLTFGCIQCHAHPYEPIPHEDYYRFYAFFNSTEDADLTDDYPRFRIADSVPQRPLAARLYQKISQLRHAINAPGRAALIAEKSWDPLHYSAASIKTTHGKLKAYPSGELHASGTLSMNTRFNLTAIAQDFSALRITIIPNTENPAELPERASVLSTIVLNKIKADGSAVNIKLAYVFADTISGPYDPVGSLGNGADGFGGYPKLFGKRQAVIIPENPVIFTDDEKLEIIIQHSATTTGKQACTLRRFRLDTSNNSKWSALIRSPEHNESIANYKEANKQYNAIKGTDIPIIKERPAQATRETRLFLGGLWLNKGDLYKPGVPGLLNGYQKKVDDRLDMAQWLTSAENPLTARVMANRLFTEMFGRGIVETLGDFGTTGTKPNNLPLLDHLAAEFQTTYKWSVKSLLREMALSATYRQDNKATPQLAVEDPGNRLLARGPRNPLSAEMVRDHALKVSGLLTKKIGGPSVMPPQPDGIWQSVYSGANWENATGSNRYRRAVYTYWKRTSPYPSMITFDAPSRDVCSAQRIPTNTPLHALTTLNDPVYLECSRALAKRMLQGVDEADINAQIKLGYLLATQQKPNNHTVKQLVDLYAKLLAHYRANQNNAEPLENTPHASARTVLANTILNLDVSLTK